MMASNIPLELGDRDFVLQIWSINTPEILYESTIGKHGVDAKLRSFSEHIQKRQNMYKLRRYQQQQRKHKCNVGLVKSCHSSVIGRDTTAYMI